MNSTCLIQALPSPLRPTRSPCTKLASATTTRTSKVATARRSRAAPSASKPAHRHSGPGRKITTARAECDLQTEGDLRPSTQRERGLGEGAGPAGTATWQLAKENT